LSAVDPVFVWVAQALVAFVFAGAALHKLRAPREFVATLRNYRVLPDAVVPIAASAAGLGELFVVVGVWLPSLRSGATLAAATLLVVYSAAIGWNLARGRRDIDCGCTWGNSAQPLSGWLLVRNAALLVTCGIAGGETGSRAAGAIDLAVALAGVAVLALCYRAFETLLANAPAVRRLRDTA
jgi:hypothetical protein